MSHNPDNKSSFIKQTLHYLSANVITKLIAFITLPLFTRYLSPTDYGIFALFTMFGTICSNFASLGLRAATYRFYFDYKHQPEEFRSLNFSNIIVIVANSTLAGVLVFLFGGPISARIFNNEISGPLLTLAFVSGMLEYVFLYFHTILIAQKKSQVYSVLLVIKISLATILSLYLVFFHSLTYMAKIYGLIFSQIIGTILVLKYTYQTIAPRFSSRMLKQSLGFAFPQIPSSIIGIIHTSFDKTMLAHLKNATSVGYYSFGEQFSGLMQVFSHSIVNSWAPYFLEKCQHDTPEAKQSIMNRFYILFYLLLLTGLCIIFFSEELIKILTTQEYYPAMYVIPILTFYHMIGIMELLSPVQIMHAKKLMINIPIYIVSVIANVVFNIIFISLYGAIGAAIATVLAGLLTILIRYYFANKIYPLPIRHYRLLFAYILCLLLIAPVYFLMAAEISILYKIIIKLPLLALFIWIGIKTNYIPLIETKKIIANLLSRGQ